MKKYILKFKFFIPLILLYCSAELSSIPYLRLCGRESPQGEPSGRRSQGIRPSALAPQLMMVKLFEYDSFLAKTGGLIQLIVIFISWS